MARLSKYRSRSRRELCRGGTIGLHTRGESNRKIILHSVSGYVIGTDPTGIEAFASTNIDTHRDRARYTIR